jgi:hypothetical protein
VESRTTKWSEVVVGEERRCEERQEAQLSQVNRRHRICGGRSEERGFLRLN